VDTTLDRLERDGLVAVEEDGGQKRYSLTAAGREALGGWWDAVPGGSQPPRDELLVKVLLAVRTRRPDHALAVITHHRTALTRLLQERRRAARGHDGDLAAQLAADALAVRAEADLRWLDLCESRVLRAADTSGAP
jgi:DNA-binding PadR family transcriptional regulator